MVMLKVSPWKGVVRFRKRGKLSLRFIGPFKIIERVGKVAYRLELPEELSGIHGTFHVSQLRKCLAEETTYIHHDDIEVDNSLNYAVKPLEILDRKVKDLRNKRIDQVKIKWEHRKGSDTTWESEEEMRRLNPTLFGMKGSRSIERTNLCGRTFEGLALKVTKGTFRAAIKQHFEEPNTNLSSFRTVLTLLDNDN
ncbi:putative Chromo-like domain superfamily protein [Helianthus annuus]|nr:putative Chromo-like domain superfamily protein [Helianthus annuus]